MIRNTPGCSRGASTPARGGATGRVREGSGMAGS
jgi:hypothetical protein